MPTGDVFAENRNKVEGIIRLLDALGKGRNFQQIVEIGYEIIGNPFAIMDSGGKTISIINAPGAEDDPQWRELSKDGYASLDFFTYYLHEKKLVQKLEESKIPFFWDDHRIKYRRILGKIEAYGKMLGTIGVIEFNRPFQDDDMELVSVLCSALSAEMQKDRFVHFTKGLMYEGFIRDLLDGTIVNSNEISERKKYVGLNLKNINHILTIDVSEFGSTHLSLNYFRNMIEDLFDRCYAIIHNDYIVAVVSCSSKKSYNESILPSIKKFLSDNNMRGGVSRGFRKLENLRAHYGQSLEALQLGRHYRKPGPLFPYEEHALNHMASICTKHSSLIMCCHPEIIALMEYDRQNNTAFIKTLYYYIINLKNLSDSANACKLHRNTMIYRIEKIKEITGIDLNDSELLLHLYFSLKLLEYQNLIEL